MLGLIFITIPIIGIAYIVVGVFFTVKQQEVAIIERLGKFHRIAFPGMHVKIPIVDKIAHIADLRTSANDILISAKTNDNVTIDMHVSTQYFVDARDSNPDSGVDCGVCRSYYMLNDPIMQMAAFISDALRSSIPKYTLDEVFEKKDDIANDVNEIVTSKMKSFGFVIVQTLITKIDLPSEVEESMNSINAAQREKVAAQDLAEADRIRKVTEAVAEAEAAQKAGEGIANQRVAIAEGIKNSLDTIKGSGVSEKEANLLFMYTQWVDMMQEFAKTGDNNTIVLPNDFEQSSSMFTQMLTANKSSNN